MGYLDQRVQYAPANWRSHKQGRFIGTPNGHLERPGGEQIDLHAFLTNHRVSINLWPIETNAMRVSGLHAGSFALVDRSLSPAPGKIVVVRCNGQVLIRRLIKKNNQWFLIADDPLEEQFLINEFTEVERLGVVTHSIIEL